jgi:hypothetical protein
MSDTPVTNVPMTTPIPSDPTLPSPSELGFDEFDSVIGMKLSDLIREGSKTTRQTMGWGNMTENACALTAAAKTLNEKGYGIPT